MSKPINPIEFAKRAKKSRLVAWSLIVVIVLTVFALIFAFFVFSTSNPTNQSHLNTVISTEANSSSTIATEDNSSSSVAPATYQTGNNEPIEITAVFWGMLVMFFLLIFSRLRQIANRR
jgi:cytoskeletal protein RodZ